MRHFIIAIFIISYGLLLDQEQATLAQVTLPIKRERRPNEIPQKIKEQLDGLCSGWQFADNYVIFEYTHPDRLKDYPFNPNLIKGDFNGDGQLDYAVQIRCSGLSERIIAFLAVDNGFQYHVLKSHSARSDNYLWLRKKGDEAYNFETEKKFEFPSDAIEVVIWEKAATSYIFIDGQWREFATGD